MVQVSMEEEEEEEGEEDALEDALLQDDDSNSKDMPSEWNKLKEEHQLTLPQFRG